MKKTVGWFGILSVLVLIVGADRAVAVEPCGTGTLPVIADVAVPSVPNDPLKLDLPAGGYFEDWNHGLGARATDGLGARATVDPEFLVSFADEKRWSIETLGTGLADVTNRHVVMYGVTTGVGYYVLDNLAIQLDVTGYGFNEGHSNGAATGITLGLRHHVLDIGRSSLFFDVSGGEIWASNNVPMRGSHLNNTFEGGIGLATPLGGDHFYLLTGVRFFHLSNANNHGGDRNPSVNAPQGVVGVMWRF